MKVDPIALSNIVFKGLDELTSHGSLSNADGYDNIPNSDAILGCDEAEFFIGLKRAMALRKTRIVIDLKYPQKR